MRRRRPVYLAALAVPLTLLQLDLSTCFRIGNNPGGGGTPISFNVPPVPVISTDAVRGVAPLTVQFSSSASTDDGLIVSRLWNFGDGQTSRDISPAHTFVSTGTFTVRLTLVDDLGASATRSVAISVTEAPVARIVVDRTAAESAPAIFNFDASQSFDPDGTIERFQWDFGDGSRELLQTVVHTFGAPGAYRVRLTVTDNAGVTGTSDVIIEVGIPRPQIQFRSPPQGISNLVVSNNSPLWVYVVFNVEPGVPRTLRAGLDGDADICNAQSVLFDVSNGTTLFSISGHTDRVRSAVFDPNGFLVVTGSDDRTVRVHDSGSGLLLQQFGGNVSPVTSVAVSPNGNLIAFGVEDGTVVVRNRSTGALLNTFAGHTAGVTSVAFSAAGDRVLSGSDDRTAILWSIATGAAVRTFAGHAFGVTSVAFSPTDSSLILTGSVDQSARLWDVNTGAILARFEPRFNASGNLTGGHSNAVTSVAFSPDGAQVLTGSDDATAKIWPITGGAELRTLTGHTDRVSAVAFSPDGKRIATGSVDASARLWDAATGALQRTLRPCASPVASVAFSPDSTTLLTGIGARNDIQLDTNPRQGNDLNLTVPTALDIGQVAAGEYFLWTEVATDRTSPARTYSSTVVNVVAPFTAGIDNFTPRAPLLNDRAEVLINPLAARQVFDLGPLRAGDLLTVDLITLPGYGRRFDDDRYSVLILDAEQKMVAWYQDSGVLFSPDTRLVIGHDSANYFAVVDAGDSYGFRIDRGAGLLGDGSLPTVEQRILLNFDAAPGLRVGDLGPVDVAVFDASALDSSFGSGETAQIKAAIKSRIEAVFAGFNVFVSTTDDTNPPLAPFQTIYFGDSNEIDGLEAPLRFGVSDFTDPRNTTVTGRAFIDYGNIVTALPGRSAAEYGAILGNAAAHQIGHLLGLRNTTGGATDIMDASQTSTSTAMALQSSPLDGNGQYGPSAIGIQDAPLLLEETIGRVP